ncbi:myo-inosose-2 dehydratase [Testudinibacter sp. TR-2022]|uniref:myo-inosose-2 dehydratase n=1 Tax=Testudinibacter sp. TR-2022 TaxID=2585029 RepID=UPI00111B7800|nr:myo-inosose-2 dehydratase [Testudinibacter sp. TR-2022]TNH00522.1 myo-inosose-2 dehydratase [Pasteurellaceae bacterium Phil31]TNH04257.1 myo-inosose-2 dehydratase [Testudinibacter sp. TR-2022]TNH09830.1 myo-inosose-2 dehydratase [Testudinibacter sp. TR-2022]TNH13875.1 myo-inosose-2 dehydratase [Testudinibacter sp. TR-2022]TNH20656.1 myo-inosose-2 dehydratase [Testudinibacter sp. TR-2022]
MKAENVKLGIAPIGWTNDDLPELGAENTFEQCVSEMALAGYEGCEVGNKYPRDVKVLKHKLDVRGIQICNAWFSTFFVDGKKEQTIKDFIEHMNFLHAMGAKVIGCSEQSRSIQGQKKAIFKEKTVFNDAEWQLLAEGYNELAKIAAEKGMKVCLHHHMGTGIQTPQEVDRYMEVTNDDVYLLFDSGHLYYSEGSQQAMLDVLEKYIDRIVHVHLKDVRDDVVAEVKANDLSFLEGVKKGTFTVPGDGVIDFKPIFAILEKHDYKGWMVVEAEQDPALANPFEYALKGRKYIKDVAGV